MATRSDRNWLNPLDLSGSERPANVIGRQSAYLIKVSNDVATKTE